MRRRLVGLAATLVIVAAPLAAEALPATGAVVATAPVVVTLAKMHPIAPQPDDSLVLSGTITNASDAQISALAVQLRMSGPISARSTFDAFADEPVGDVSALPYSLTEPQPLSEDTLAAGDSEPFQIKVPLDPATGKPFGYRVEVQYSMKDDQKCRTDPSTWNLETKNDCVIDPNEEFVTPLAPFGIVMASGTPSIRVRLNQDAANRLTSGVYNANVVVTYDNGNQSQFAVRYRKATPSGEYAGTLAVYLDGASRTALKSALARMYDAALADHPAVARIRALQATARKA